LLLSSKKDFLSTDGNRLLAISMSLKRIVLCFNVSAGIFTNAIPRMGER
jgi:hypothetical protein